MTRRCRDEPSIYLICIHGYEPRDFFNLESATTNSCFVYTSYFYVLNFFGCKSIYIISICQIFCQLFYKMIEKSNFLLLFITLIPVL